MIRGNYVSLSKTEWEVSHLDSVNSGRTMTHCVLLPRIWRPDLQKEKYDPRSWIHRIRKRLRDQQDASSLTKMVPGIGYRLDKPNTSVDR